MRPKSAKGAETKAQIIRVAADLFHKQGVGATSPDDVISASNTVARASSTTTSRAKRGLGHEVLQTHLRAIKTGSATIDYDISSWEDLESRFFAHVELQKTFGMKRGCPFGTIGNELGEGDELVRQDLSLIFEVMKNKLMAFFIREKAKSRIAKDTKEDRLADFCIASVQGAMLMGKIQRSSEVAEGHSGKPPRTYAAIRRPSEFEQRVDEMALMRVRSSRRQSCEQPQRSFYADLIVHILFTDPTRVAALTDGRMREEWCLDGVGIPRGAECGGGAPTLVCRPLAGHSAQKRRHVSARIQSPLGNQRREGLGRISHRCAGELLAAGQRHGAAGEIV
jgi:AcrR family transcriptional regulator